MRRMMIVILSVVAAVVLFLVLCTFRVRPYERDTLVVVRFGQLVKPTRIAYGWYVCLPTDQVVRLDGRLHLYQSLTQQTAAAGGDSISVRAFAAWKIKDGERFYKRFNGSDEMAQQVLGKKLVGSTGAVFGKHSLDQLFNTDETKLKTVEMEQEVRDAVNKGGDGEQGMVDMGLEVEHVGFSRLSFPPQVADSIYQRMVEERKRQATAFESEGKANATRIRAEGNQVASDTLAVAAREGQQLMGEGDAEALKILQSAQTPEAREFYQFWREMELFKASFRNSYVVWRSGEPLTDLLSTHRTQVSGAATQPGK